jgi:pimeloyl-ACP methyl ester carboxylesterase
MNRARAHVTGDRTCTDEPALVLVPGLGVSHRYLMPFARHMAVEYGHRCYALDLPGFGTWRKQERPLTVVEQAERVAEWLEREGLTRAALLGNSLGCEVIVHLAVRHPERVACLVLTSPTIDPRGRTALQTVWRLLCDVPREPPRIMPIVAQDWLATGPLWMARGLAAMLRDPIEELLPLVQCPALVVRGERDAIVPGRWAQAAGELLPQGRLAEVPGAIHAVPFDTPQALADLVHSFLAEASKELATVSRETVTVSRETV